MVRYKNWKARLRLDEADRIEILMLPGEKNREFLLRLAKIDAPPIKMGRPKIPRRSTGSARNETE